MSLIPVTILTGFLGSGKTTLLSRILQEPHGRRIAVIENEFGAVGIDHELLVHEGREQIVEMNNGCICCTVRGDLIRILHDLVNRRASGAIAFDQVVIETTGLAQPAPVVQTFFMDDKVCEHFAIDSILTMVDARHAMQQLDSYREAQEQVGFADRLLVSKRDLVTMDDMAALKDRLRRLNPHARIETVCHGEASIDSLLGLDAFNLARVLDVAPDFLEGDDHGHHPHGHSDGVHSFVFTSEHPFEVETLDQFFAAIVQVYGPRLLRYKGILSLVGHDLRVVLQGVHMVTASAQGEPWADNEVRQSRLVFIVKDLEAREILAPLELCLVKPGFEAAPGMMSLALLAGGSASPLPTTTDSHG